MGPCLRQQAKRVRHLCSGILRGANKIPESQRTMQVGRFQVMAVLQAARAHILGLPLASAHSWGLNRAIFHAAAKRGFRGRETGAAGAAVDHGPRGRTSTSFEEYHLGNELAYRDKTSSKNKPMFMIGGVRQTEEDFKRQIERRFRGGSFRDAWEEALDYLQHFERTTLESQSAFFSDVYRPKRDEFAKRWSEMGDAEAPTVLPAGASRLPSRGVLRR